MKLLRLDIGGFGRLASLSIEFGEGLTVIAGPNEAGKTTIVECVLRLLFGFPERQFTERLARYAPWAAGAPYQASLTYRLDDDRVYEVTRNFAKPDVPTETVEADTRRPVAELSGNKSTSPGETALGLTLEVYKAAALVRAGDFAEGAEKDNTARALSDRLAAVVASAGDASAADAVARLQKVGRDIGSTGANTPLGKAIADAERAQDDLRRYRNDYAGFAENLTRRAALEDNVRELHARRQRCDAAYSALRVRSLRARIAAATEATQALSTARVRRSAIVGGVSPELASRRADIESSIEALRSAEGAEADVAARAATRELDHAAVLHDLDTVSAELLEKRAALSRIEETIAGYEAACAGRPPVDGDALADLERQSDEADAAESRERTLATHAAIARQRGRGSPVGVTVATVVALALGASSYFTRSAWLAAAAGAFAVVAIVLGVAVGLASRRRAAVIAAAEAKAAEAAVLSERLIAELGTRCRRLGFTNVAAVRAARAAQVDLDRVRAQRDTTAEASRLLAGQRELLQSRIDDFAKLRADDASARALAAQRRTALAALLDAAGVPAGTSGTIDERITEYRNNLDAGEDGLRADNAVSEAQAALDRALGGATIESLEDAARAAAANAAAAASGGDPAEFAGRAEDELDRELGAIDAHLRDAELSLHGAIARTAEFNHQHPVAMAELEERAATRMEEVHRLKHAKDAAKTAWETIDAVKDTVHRDFAPVLNEAIGRAAIAITGGRYAQAWVDPADFTVRVRIPETGDTPAAADALSTGTIEQFQFALRAALAMALGSGERVPILFDDALAHADDARLAAAIEHAAALAREGHQIIFLTQRGEAISFAERIPDARVVMLAGPGV